ncbi:indole-3-glycerol phosphate synthase TrpC [Candidatus Poribacteria bacterium]|nr:indole-3-glycerol phosphate synthase TrpC [Candidatus Poribacteria bacterium]MYB65957.1 indole-3-glycerol phosphate synthase TrpC [Candidatus Poribacteria bacterium]MYF54955.1 indole-3-glycerol phosphate synthase TrpC [Candidatus Poribacteria bacterium]MYI93938.1 indole-3-glycerol phosphate synthase TrpC [Candidatus Poribacteria bacterium]
MILDTIVAHKRKELLDEQDQISLSELKSKLTDVPPTQDFFSAITNPNSINLIAEVKKKSPSKGIIRSDFDPVQIANTYQENGAAAISVLTDKHFFDGNLSYLSSIREAVNLPLLRKDFTIHPYHIFQARVAGADAVLLIVAVLTSEQLKEYIEIAESLSLASLVEVHTEEELEIALDADAAIIGINNRDLRTFNTTLDTTFKLLELIPEDKVVVSESGIYTRDDVEALWEVGVNAILVGESLMRSPDIGEKVRELIG